MTPSFADLGVRAELVSALGRQGITSPFPIQELTVRDALAGRDVCGQARTGSGKTLAFGLPLVERVAARAAGRRVRGLVLVPTRELAGQVLEVVRPLADAVGLRVAALYGGAALAGQLSKLEAGTDVVVATPGRLIDMLERGAVSLAHVELLVVDEADRMADMGFLPQVEWILRRMQGARQTLLFSATLDGDVEILVRRHLSDPVRHDVVEEEAAQEMTHRFLAVHQLDRVKVAAAIARGVTRTLLFARTKRGADRLTEQLRREGVRAEAIHGDLRQSAREQALAAFKDGRLQLLVATDVAARGIHIDDVDVVIHYDPPEDHKAYTHRSGRTARAGRTGTVATFVLWNQVAEVQRLLRRLGIDEPIVEVFSNDPRLADLGSVESPATRSRPA